VKVERDDIEVDVKVERDTREATMVALDRKILRTIATQRYRKQLQQGSREYSPTRPRLSIDEVSEKLVAAMPASAPVQLKASDIICAKRNSTEDRERSHSKGSARSKSTSKSPRGRDNAMAPHATRQANEQSQEKIKERKEKKRLAFELMAGLEDRAKQAADRHLQERANRLDTLRADIKEKREAKLQKVTRTSGIERAHTDGDSSPRKRTTMLRTTARSLLRSSVASTGQGYRPSVSNSRKL